MHHLVAHFGRQRIGVTHIPRINLPLRFVQLPERRRGFRIAGSQVMGHALQVRLPHNVHEVDMIEGAQNVTESDGPGCKQLLLWERFESRVKKIVRPGRITRQRV